MILLVVVIGVVAKLNAPSKGIVNQHPTTKIKPHISTQQPNPSTQKTAYYTLNLPAGFAEISSGTAPSGTLAIQTLTKQLAIGKLVIAIAVKPTPEGGVTSDSAYQLRAAHPERYSFSTNSINGDTVTIANDSQSAAVVAFWQHQNYLATISLTMGFEGPPDDGNADELAQLQTILNAWQWN